MSNLILSPLQVDQEQIASQLVDDLSKNAVWQTIYTASIGQTLIGWLASIGAYEQYAIQRALEETALDTAKQDQSIITISRMLGTHIKRKIPGSITCVIASPFTTTVKAYSQFTLSDGSRVFNRQDIALIANINTTVTLYEGIIVSEDILSPGGSFQRFNIGLPNKNYISDSDIFANTATNLLTASTNFNSSTIGIWKFSPGQRTFYENTMPDGSLEILFGNNIYGAAPLINNIITFTYAITNGLAGNTVIAALPMYLDINKTITGVTTTSISGGLDEFTADFYKQFNPFIYSKKDRAVTQSDLIGLSLTYPDQNITDIVFLGQKDTHPNNPIWMNFIQYSLLTTNPTFDNSAFEQWLSTHCVFQANFYNISVTKVGVSIQVDVFCKPKAILLDVIANVTNALILFFTAGIGTIGKNIYLSNLYDVIKSSDSSILYSKLLAPSADLIISVPGTVNPIQLYASLNTTDGIVPDIAIHAHYV